MLILCLRSLHTSSFFSNVESYLMQSTFLEKVDISAMESVNCVKPCAFLKRLRGVTCLDL